MNRRVPTSIAVTILMIAAEYAFFVLPAAALLWLAGWMSAAKIGWVVLDLFAIWTLAVLLVTHVWRPKLQSKIRREVVEQ